jgi:hypothetical protein
LLCSDTVVADAPISNRGIEALIRDWIRIRIARCDVREQPTADETRAVGLSTRGGVLFVRDRRDVIAAPEQQADKQERAHLSGS